MARVAFVIVVCVVRGRVCAEIIRGRVYLDEHLQAAAMLDPVQRRLVCLCVA